MDIMNDSLKRPRIGLAVSGGIDSCYLIQKYATQTDTADYGVLSVDHNLRPESASEVLWVKAHAENLGLEFYGLKITDKKPTSKIQEYARNARYKLLAQAAKEHQLDSVYLGHHSNDQAETILSRLNHSSGYAGLCGMPEIFYYDDICFKRPLLNLSRHEITQSMHNTPYLNDPSNDNPKYERVRNRQFLTNNVDLTEKLLTLSKNAQSLYYPLLLERNMFLKDHAILSPYGYCHINHHAFATQSPLLQQEILKYAIKYVTGNFYIKTIPALNAKNFTLSGAEICFSKNTIKIYCENRNLDDTKRFINADSGNHKDTKDIPFKARQTLPNGCFTYKPQSLCYFVTVFDRIPII
jgi:tRNA(Ile)-lysidine synthase